MSDVVPWEAAGSSGDSVPWASGEEKPATKVKQPSIYASSKEWEAYRAAQKAGNAEPKKQEGIGPIQPFSLKETAKGVGQGLAGIVEAPLAAVTGGLGAVAGGVAGAGRMAGGMLAGEDFDTAASAGADWTKGVRGSVSYQPRTDVGQGMMAVVGAPFTLGSKVLGAGGRAAGDLIGPKTGAALETVGEALPEAAGALTAAHGLRKSMATGRAPLSQDQAAIKKAMDAGFKALPSEARPGSLSATAEAGAYKPELIQEMILHNEKLASSMVKNELGLTKTQPLNYESLETMRGTARTPVPGVRDYGAAYDRVRAVQGPIDISRVDPQFLAKAQALDTSLSSLKQVLPEAYYQPKFEQVKAGLARLGTPGEPPVTAAQLVDTIKALRSLSDKAVRVATDEPTLTAAHSMRQGAAMLENVLDTHLQNSGRGQLYADFVEARKKIAQSYDAQDALRNPTLGYIDPQVLRQKYKRREPLSGDFLTIAESADALPSVVRSASETEARSVGGIRMGISTPFRKSLQTPWSQERLKPKGDIERPPFRMDEFAIGAIGTRKPQDESSDR